MQADVTRLRAEIAAPKPAAAPDAPPSGEDPEPTPDKYDTYEKYVKAQAKWEAQQEITATLAKERDAYAERDRQQTWRARVDAVKKVTPDWDARFKPDTPIDRRLMPYLTAQEQGPQVLLYLSDHQDLAQRIATLHPIDQIGEIGKILARLDAAPVSTGPAPTPAASQAKPPITPVTASPHVPDGDEYSEDEPVEKFIARENAREKKASRRA
jgi:hypothetical protein